MKITFKDGKVVENIVSVSITNLKKNGVYTPMVNIVFDKGVGFSDLEGVITDENISQVIIDAANGEVSRTLTGFNKVYMSENISDANCSFVVSLEKDIEGTVEETAPTAQPTPVLFILTHIIILFR